MSNLHLFFFILGLSAFTIVMALTLTAILERREDGDA